MNAETVEHVGTLQSKQLNTVNIEMFRHPKYYKELRKLRNKSDQAISDSVDPASGVDSVRPGPGHKRQASSAKLTKSQASSGKHQAPSNKRQA